MQIQVKDLTKERLDLRRVGTHPDYWYPVAWSHEVKKGAALGARFAGDPVVLYRGASGRPMRWRTAARTGRSRCIWGRLPARVFAAAITAGPMIARANASTCRISAASICPMAYEVTRCTKWTD